MGSNNHCNINYNKNFGNDDGGAGGSGRPPGSGNFGLARQSSVYSLTFDEFQNALGGMGKDFGSMNMDELLRSIWSADETQSMPAGPGAAAMVAAAAAAAVGSNGLDGGNSGGYLQTQGSLILRQKTVDEVWKDVVKEWSGGKDGGGGSNVPQKQQTLGEVTLEEFLVRAGVVKDDTQLIGKPNDSSGAGIFGKFSQPRGNTDDYGTTNTGYGINFQQSGRGVELIGNRITDTNQQIPIQSANLPLNVNGVRTSQQQATATQLSQQPQSQHQQPLFPKQSAVSYAQLGGAGMRGGMVGLVDSGINRNLVQSGFTQCGGGMGMVELGGGGVIDIRTRSPAALSSDLLGRSKKELSSVSPAPYMFNGGLRGRRGVGAVDKVAERRHRRMIKNRESAARSRARKQAYTMELEQEVQKLKEENEDLIQKQAEIVEMQKNQVMEMINAQSCSKKLRRMQTGPW